MFKLFEIEWQDVCHNTEWLGFIQLWFWGKLLWRRELLCFYDYCPCWVFRWVEFCLYKTLENIVIKNHCELLKNQMQKKMKAQPIFKRIITHSWRSRVSIQGWPRQLWERWRRQRSYKSLLIRYKEAKCKIETLNGKLSEVYTKVRFLEQEVVQANAKIERVSIKKLDDIISSQKHFSDKFGLEYTGRSSSSGNITKEVKFIKAKEPFEVGPTAEKPRMEEKRNVENQRMLNNPRNQSMGRSESRAKSRPRPQRGLRSNYVCHHYGLQGHTWPNC